jgi:hypothetical protein
MERTVKQNEANDGNALVPADLNSPEKTGWLPEVEPSGIGSLMLTDDERSILSEPAEFSDWEVTPTGAAYLPHIWYRDRLAYALGFGSFTCKTIRVWDDAGHVYVHAALYVRNVLVADSVGAGKYQPKNPRLDYSDAFKAAKSDAFRRCCADAGLGTGPWHRRQCEQFLKEHCIRVMSGGQLVWRRKDQPPFENERPLTKS